MKFMAWRKYLLPVMILALLLIPGCRGCNSDNGCECIPAPAPGVKPVVEAVVPGRDAINIALNNNITVTFSKPMASTNASTTFLLKTAGIIVPGLVTYDGLVAKFDPDANLLPSTIYNVTITTEAKDTEGNSLAEDYNWSFTTGLVVDEIRPMVVSTNPADGSIDVPVNKAISVPFSEAMDALSLNNSTFYLTGPLGLVEGKVVCVGFTAVFTPTALLTKGALYTGTITTGVKDIAGNSMLVDHVWSFTGVEAESIRPTVASTDPADNDIDVATNKKISVRFSEEMNPLTIVAANFEVKDPLGVTVPGMVTYAGLTAIFTPSVTLTNGLIYSTVIKTGASDLAGNFLLTDFTWKFTTGLAPDSTAPKVASTDPAKDADNVAINQRVGATFNEGMDSTTINTTTFTVKKADGTAVSGAVTFAGLVANFVPAVNFEFNTLYTATIASGSKDLAGNAMAANYVWNFTTGAAADKTAPSVVSTDPANGKTDVGTNQKIAATFSESMNSATLHTGTFTITGPGTTVVPGTVAYANLTANFTPSVSLQNDTIYTGTIASGAKDLAGNALTAFVWTFTTGSAPDSIAPAVVSTDPALNAKNVDYNKTIAVTFSESMNSATINDSTFTVTKLNGAAVVGEVGYSGLIANFNPDSNLDPVSTYTCRITTGAKDLAGNTLATTYTWEFATSAMPDTTAPTVTLTDPSQNQTDVPTNKIFAVTFSENMDTTTIKTSTFTVTKPDGSALAGTVNYSGKIANFTPAATLANSSTYTARITTGAKDLAGNALAANYTWKFSTGAAPDSTVPTVVSTDPADAETNVAFNKTLAVTFSESMNSATINTTVFSLKKQIDGTSVSGAVTYSGLIAYFNPTADLAADATYTATITSGAKDLAGNALATKVWSFRTGLAPDIIPPTVLSSIPVANTANVAIGSAMSVTFDEAMDAGSINTVSFKVVKLTGETVAGTVSYSGKIATFTPSASLANNATYTATITTVAEDLAGNALAANYAWTFKTVAALDSVAPTVTLTDPALGATGVATNQKIAVTFSESMNPATLHATTFTIAGPGSTAVAGTITYANLIANFTPTSVLLNDTTYTGTVTTGAKDLAGNALTRYVWTFKTGLAQDSTAPVVASTDPAANARNVDFNKTLAVTFSESMNSATINATTFTVTKLGGAAVTGLVTYSGLIANFNTDVDLDPNATYTARITNAAADLAGNTLAADYAWDFTTGLAPDVIPPAVTLTDPANNQTGVPTNKIFAVTFSENMDSTTIKTSTFLVAKPDGSALTGTVTYAGKTANFTPAAVLASTATYTARITTGAKDLAGNAISAEYLWRFTTSAAPDTTVPTVVSTDPADNATNVEFNKTVAVTFSESMNSATINGTTLTLKKQIDGTSVTGVVSYGGLVANFNPNVDLAADATYTATITSGAKDLAGNAVVAKVWNFRTGLAPDTTLPTVLTTAPAGNEKNVFASSSVAVTFSEEMDSGSINTLSFKVAKLDGTPVVGTVLYAGKIATFTPSSNLAYNATYTATVTTAAQDLADNAIAVNYVWNFTTGSVIDITSPTVTITDPAAGMIDVPINQPIKATFSEDMDADTINDQTFKIAGMTGAVTYDAFTKTATFKPAANFAISYTYTVTIASGVKDLAGNTLNGNTVTKDHVWSFTTGLRTLAQPVALGDAAPFGNFGGSAGMTNMGTLTVVNGDIGTTGASTMITGFHDAGGNVYTETTSNSGLVTGTIFTATAPPGSTPGETAAAGAYDTNVAYIKLSPGALPGGMDVSAYGGGAGDLGNRVLKPGIYKSAPGSYKIQGGPLTLDAQNDENAVWVFQMASTLTVGGPGAAFPQSVILINGAQAKNVYWQVGSAGTINAGGGGTMVGTIIAQAGVTFSTAGNVTVVTLNGRALSLESAVTLVNTVINVPAE